LVTFSVLRIGIPSPFEELELGFAYASWLRRKPCPEGRAPKSV